MERGMGMWTESGKSGGRTQKDRAADTVVDFHGGVDDDGGAVPHEHAGGDADEPAEEERGPDAVEGHGRVPDEDCDAAAVVDGAALEFVQGCG